jgi:hypothetical protein
MKEKVTGCLPLSFEEQWGYKAVRTHFDKECILAVEKFHLVWWKGLCKTRKDFSKLYCIRVWIPITTTLATQPCMCRIVIV